MKARLVPLYFKSARNEEFDNQIERLKDLLFEEVEILDPVSLGSPIPEADAVVFPQLVGEAFKQIEKIKNINIPIIVITSEFGTVNIWDWEIVTFMKEEGLNPFAPYNLKLTKIICRTLALKREMKNAKFLVFQDNPGEGMQASIFKRFYWWEDECTKLIKKKFGISIIKKSFKKLGIDAKNISDSEAEKVLKIKDVNALGVSGKAMKSAVKLYIALKGEIDKEDNVVGVGMNCLNESFYSDTTPCLAYNWLYEDEGILWACEGDIMSLLTIYIINKSLGAPIMMSNVYPFLVGMAALKHEKINEFPKVEDPDNCLLVVHCGYMGFIPQSCATEWTLKPKVLEIVDDNATMVDARMPEGDITFIKLHPKLNKIQVIEGELKEYKQYPGSDCMNGALIRISDGHKLMDELYSHHNCITSGHKGTELKFVARALDLYVKEI